MIKKWMSPVSESRRCKCAIASRTVEKYDPYAQRLSRFLVFFSKGLVASRPENESLSLKLARGTTVVEDHEQAIVDLCGNEDQSESEAEQCVLDFLKSGYDYANDSDDSMETGDDVDAADNAAEEEDLVGNMYSMWNEDMPAASPKPEPIPASEAASVVKPWSSRSSPSGTFIRDPTTGKMKNIDA